MWLFAIIIFCVLVFMLTLTANNFKPESRRKIHSSKQTRKYIREKIKIDNKHCSNLPSLDSRGIYGGVSGSFTDRTGKFSEEYQRDINKLNKEFGSNVNDE